MKTRKVNFLKLTTKTLFSVFIFVSFISFSTANVVLVGKVPGEYLGLAKTKSHLAAITIEDKVIKKISSINESEVAKFKNSSLNKVLVLKNSQGQYDVIYPGLIDLHNHTKQNMIGVWDSARGQFANRFEWRAWSNYKKSVSGNMNPWISLGKPITCAAFRWSELQAMVLGTTYLQGPSSCVNNFGIHKVEDRKAYLSPKKTVQAPTDIILPGDMVFVWNTLRPIMEKENIDYANALKKVIHQYCPALKTKINNVLAANELKILSDKEALSSACGITSKEDEEKFPKKFLRYIYWVHKTIVGKINYLNDPNHAAIIGHLAEGRRLDPYNKIEFPLLKLLGLDRKHVNLVHGVSLNNSEYAHMSKKGMGLVWSPFSNLLLYGESARIDLAFKNKVLVALGSDWTPTGSRGVLEELKLAKQYVLKDPDKVGLRKIVSDEVLYKMVTEYPAKMINHFEDNPNDNDHGIGTIKVGAMASFVIMNERVLNPYTNLVDAHSQNISLVVVDGKPVYGNNEYLNNYDSTLALEELSNKVFDNNSLRNAPPSPGDKLSKEEKLVFLNTLGAFSKKLNFKTSTNCKFKNKKSMVVQSLKDKDLISFNQNSGANLSTFTDIYRLLAASILTQSRNLVDPVKGDIEFAMKKFPPLYSCEDPEYEQRLYGFVKHNSSRDEMTVNKLNRSTNRSRFGSKPRSMADSYKLEYNKEDY